MFKSFRTLGVILTLLVTGLLTTALIPGEISAGSGKPEAADKTLAPYFVVLSDDPKVDALPLKSTRADVKIAGVVAEVKITQVYRNTGQKTLEAIYVFPGSTRAAVHAMRMTIGERVVEASIMERQKARETYDAAKKEGKTASLLEQQRPNVFQMNLANILPNDEIKVELKYMELLIPEDHIYEFVYPTVVGPRYTTKTAAGAVDTDKWVQNPYLHEGQAPPYTFGLNVELTSGVPIASVTSSSHDVEIKYSGKTTAQISLKDEKTGGNKDFVLRYTLAGGKIETGLLLYPGQEENFFMLMMEPPARVKPEAVLPREYIFIVDVSGSMHGFPLDTAKALMTKYRIPTAAGRSFRSYDQARRYLRQAGAPVVVKADGLAAGKGVIVCQTEKEALEALERVMVKREFGEAGSQAVIGSTCISYGSISTPLSAADLLGRIFWGLLEEGFPAGEALRRAKLQLVREMHRRQGYLDPEDQKTVISFVLYGDPLAQPYQLHRNPKSLYRSAHLPYSIQTVSENPQPAEHPAPISPEVVSHVKSILTQYLPGMADAQLHLTQTHSDHTDSAPQDAQPPSPAATPHLTGRQVVMVSKSIQQESLNHAQYARLTMDASGKLLKLTVSR